MQKQKTGGERISVILNVFMILAYALGGVALFFWKIPAIPDQNRKILAGVLILYSGLRAFKLLRKKNL